MNKYDFEQFLMNIKQLDPDQINECISSINNFCQSESISFNKLCESIGVFILKNKGRNIGGEIALISLKEYVDFMNKNKDKRICFILHNKDFEIYELYINDGDYSDGEHAEENEDEDEMEKDEVVLETQKFSIYLLPLTEALLYGDDYDEMYDNNDYKVDELCIVSLDQIRHKSTVYLDKFEQFLNRKNVFKSKSAFNKQAENYNFYLDDFCDGNSMDYHFNNIEEASNAFEKIKLIADKYLGFDEQRDIDDEIYKILTSEGSDTFRLGDLMPFI